MPRANTLATVAAVVTAIVVTALFQDVIVEIWMFIKSGLYGL